MTDYKKLTTTAAAALLLASGNAMASGSHAGFYYADLGDWGDGFGLEGSFKLGDNFRLFGDLTFVDDGPFELDIVRIGGGYVIPMNQQMSFEVGGSYQNWDMSFDDPFFGSMSEDDNAFGLHGRLNFAVNEQFHLNGGLELLFFDDADDDEVVVSARGTFFLNPEFSLFGGFEAYTGDVVDDTMIKIGASFNF